MGRNISLAKLANDFGIVASNLIDSPSDKPNLMSGLWNQRNRTRTEWLPEGSLKVRVSWARTTPTDLPSSETLNAPARKESSLGRTHRLDAYGYVEVMVTVAD